MNRLESTFKKLVASGEHAFVPFLVAGDPDPESFTGLARVIEPHADIMEFGIPYTDPIADGPVIQAADARALAAGTTFSGACDLIARVRGFTGKPIVVLTYANVVGVGLAMARSLAALARAGVDGLIIADVPAEEAHGYVASVEDHGMLLISLVAPTTSDDRMAAIVKQAKGFLYLVAVKGVTGARASLLDETRVTMQRVTGVLGGARALPVCVGFGISTPAQVREVIKLGATGVIVGSAIVSIIANTMHDKDRMFLAVADFAREMKAATRDHKDETARVA